MSAAPALRRASPRTAVIRGVEDGPNLADTGLLLLDQSLRIIACDRGADAILSQRDGLGMGSGGSKLPAEILEILRNRSGDANSLKAHCRLGGSEYILRVYVVEPQDGVNQPVMALHLERDAFTLAAISDITAPYNLTYREQEAFAGILLGLSTKELADRMNISPNTVKAFLRLIMIKMGVTTRAGIVARILQGRTSLEGEYPGPSPPPRRTHR